LNRSAVPTSTFDGKGAICLRSSSTRCPDVDRRWSVLLCSNGSIAVEGVAGCRAYENVDGREGLLAWRRSRSHWRL
jgi:hypothetical protein